MLGAGCLCVVTEAVISLSCRFASMSLSLSSLLPPFRFTKTHTVYAMPKNGPECRFIRHSR